MELFLGILIIFGFIGLFCDWEKFMLLTFCFIVIAGGTGYTVNIIHLVNCDFKPSYKEEVIRGLGIVIPPMGAVTGYMNLEK